VITRARPFIMVLAAFALLPPAFTADNELKTRITGGAMDIRKSGEQVVFTEGAVITRGDSVLNAEKVVQDKKNGFIEAFGDVNFRMFTADKELLLGRGGKARYDTEMVKGRLSEGRPKLDYYVKQATVPVEMEADTIDFDQEKEEIFGQGNVIILSSSGTATGPAALFQQRSKRMILTGSPQPMLIYGQQGSKDKGKYWADKITFFMSEQKILLEGNVKGILVNETRKR
jgi:lipopolysaccharide export system protein LptA